MNFVESRGQDRFTLVLPSCDVHLDRETLRQVVHQAAQALRISIEQDYVIEGNVRWDGFLRFLLTPKELPRVIKILKDTLEIGPQEATDIIFGEEYRMVDVHEVEKINEAFERNGIDSKAILDKI